MKERSAKEQDRKGTPVKFVPAHILDQRRSEIQDMIARRAYELFEYRGRVPGHEIQDWMQAESELVHPCRHDLKESEEAIILHAELPGSYTADQLKVSVEERRLIVSGERELSVLCGDASGTHSEVRSHQIFRVHDLSADVDLSKATAILRAIRSRLCYRKHPRPKSAAKEHGQHNRGDGFSRVSRFEPMFLTIDLAA